MLLGEDFTRLTARQLRRCLHNGVVERLEAWRSVAFGNRQHGNVARHLRFGHPVFEATVGLLQEFKGSPSSTGDTIIRPVPAWSFPLVWVAGGRQKTSRLRNSFAPGSHVTASDQTAGSRPAVGLSGVRNFVCFVPPVPVRFSCARQGREELRAISLGRYCHP